MFSHVKDVKNGISKRPCVALSEKGELTGLISRTLMVEDSIKNEVSSMIAINLK